MRTRSLIPLFSASTVLLLLMSVGVSADDTTLTDNEQLGKSLFFDENLSVNSNQSCATCHDPAAGWVGPDSMINAHGSVYEGSVAGMFGDRKPPSAAYATQSPVLHVDKKGLFVGGNFWDGRATGEKLGNPAADQAQGPFLNPMEQAFADSACVVYEACMADYPVALVDVWGADACDITWPATTGTICHTVGGTLPLEPADRVTAGMAYDQIALSIAAYEGSSEVNAFDSKYDLSLVGQAQLTKEERLGFALFQGQGKCKLCHISSGKKALFTDYTFDNLGIPINSENPVYERDPDFVDLGLGGFLLTRDDYSGYADDYMGTHKVPTLRNVDLRPTDDDVKAYGHNGYFKSLWGIVHFYNTRDVLPTCPGDYTEEEALAANCWPAPEVADNVNTAELGDLGLTYEEELAIVAFLTTLSDGYTP